MLCMFLRVCVCVWACVWECVCVCVLVGELCVLVLPPAGLSVLIRDGDIDVSSSCRSTPWRHRSLCINMLGTNADIHSHRATQTHTSMHTYIQLNIHYTKYRQVHSHLCVMPGLLTQTQVHIQNTFKLSLGCFQNCLNGTTHLIKLFNIR